MVVAAVLDDHSAVDRDAAADLEDPLPTAGLHEPLTLGVPGRSPHRVDRLEGLQRAGFTARPIGRDGVGVPVARGGAPLLVEILRRKSGRVVRQHRWAAIRFRGIYDALM